MLFYKKTFAEYKNKINNSDKKDEQESKEISMYDVRSGM